MNIKNHIRDYLPDIIHEIFISIYNTFLYKVRHGSFYKEQLKYHELWLNHNEIIEIKNEQLRRLNVFLKYSRKHSVYYSQVIPEKASYDLDDLKKLPILNKEVILSKLEEISTVSEDKSIVSYTGGTTGSSMKVLYCRRDMQERFAVLDTFRGQFGYKLGKKTAWFSGKELLSPKDLRKNKFYKDDFINKIRFYSTFNISKQNFSSYWETFCNFQPEYIVGFPSSVYDICRMADDLNLSLENKVRVFFPTAETVLPHHRFLINKILGCTIIDQYASSEGAPFIVECSYGKLHMQLTTGVFEIVDEELEPADVGEILVTSFTTTGTPLIRYRVGDRIKISKNTSCLCNSAHPQVEYIDGRSSDYVHSIENGRVYLGNLSNCTKDVQGIESFQILQDTEEKIEVKVISSPLFVKEEKENFIKALKERVGQKMEVSLVSVSSIPKEKSGKFRLVINNLSK